MTTDIIAAEELAQQLDSIEAARSLVFPIELSDDEKAVAAAQLKAARKAVQAQATDEQRLVARLMQLKFQLEDYLNKDEFDENHSFASFLTSYLNIIQKKRNEFAREIDIHETLLSQLINGHRKPGENIIIRLELHSNQCIPADYWFRLVQKEQVHEMRTNQVIRKAEKIHVANQIAVRI